MDASTAWARVLYNYQPLIVTMHEHAGLFMPLQQLLDRLDMHAMDPSTYRQLCDDRDKALQLGAEAAGGSVMTAGQVLGEGG